MFGHTAYGLASGLVSASMAEEFLLFLFTQTHHGCTQGTWTFWEKVLIDRSKSTFSGSQSFRFLNLICP